MSADSAQPVPESLVRGAHVTVSRAVQILEIVVSSPGVSYAEITRAVGAPKSSVYGFIRGMLAVSWLIERGHRIFVGPAFYSLVLADGQLRAGMVTAADLDALYRETGLAAVVNVRAGDHLIDIARSGPDDPSLGPAGADQGDLLTTAGGKALLAFASEEEMFEYLHRYPAQDRPRVQEFLQTWADIRARNVAISLSDASGQASIASVIHNGAGHPSAAVTLVGSPAQVLSRVEVLSALLVGQVGRWAVRSRSGSE